jgi:methylmalonyl-CoA/ethylmalonyl-CoA epimerase
MNTALLESKFGPILQVAYVVENLDNSIQSWDQQMGVRPFAVARDVAPFVGAKYRGENCDDMRMSLGFAYMGDVQLELIEQRDDRPSIYKEMLDRGNPGLHHYCFGVEDYASAYEQAISSGFQVVVQAGDANGGMIYCESQGIPGLILEIIPWDDSTKPYFEGTREFLTNVNQNQLIHEMSL